MNGEGRQAEPELTIGMGWDEAGLLAAVLVRDGEAYRCSTWHRKGRTFFYLRPNSSQHTTHLIALATSLAREFLSIEIGDGPEQRPALPPRIFAEREGQ